MKKRIGSLLMALVLALSLVPATVWAADDPISVGTFEALKAAVDAENSTIILTADIDLTEPLRLTAGQFGDGGLGLGSLDHAIRKIAGHEHLGFGSAENGHGLLLSG